MQVKRGELVEGLVKEPLPTSVPVKDDMTIEDAIAKLEGMYSKKEAEVKEAQEAFFNAQTKFAQCEHEALGILRQLTPLQNRYLMNVIESQKKKLSEVCTVVD